MKIIGKSASEGFNKCGIEKCKKCAYWTRNCDYVLVEGHTRGCLPNRACTVYLSKTRKNMRYVRTKYKDGIKSEKDKIYATS